MKQQNVIISAFQCKPAPQSISCYTLYIWSRSISAFFVFGGIYLLHKRYRMTLWRFVESTEVRTSLILDIFFL